MRTYHSYHTCIKQLAKKNCIPEKYLEYIDRSTIWRWKQEPEDKYVGTELSNLEVLERFLSRNESESILRTYLKVAAAFSGILSASDQLREILKQNKKAFIHTILKYRSRINMKIILRLCSIPISVYHYWKHQVMKPCRTSPLNLCKKIYPNQLTNKEVLIMKRLLTDQKFKYWPVCSIAFYALRENLLNISLSTWYHYVRKLGIARPVLPKKKSYDQGIRASRPHEIWHADIMIMKTLDGIKSYIYFLMDNYSRMIINWNVESGVSGKVRLGTIKEAYNTYIQDSGEDVILLVDGGTENNNDDMDSYIGSDNISLCKWIAQKDTAYSNSVIESQNKLIKYRYLFKENFQDIHELRNGLDWMVHDYNHNRPHISLQGLTPHEVMTGTRIPKDKWHEQICQARKFRISENSEERCDTCK